MGLARPIFGATSYVLGLNIPGKFQGHSSRASYICQVRHFGILGISDYHLGGLQPPALALGPVSLQRYIQRNTVYESEKLGFSGLSSFGDMKAQILHLVQWQRPHRSCRLKFSKSERENCCRSYALFLRFVTR